MKTITFEGHKISYDERAPQKWSVQKALALGADDPAGFYKAIDTILAGKSDEYAALFDDDADKMLELLDRISLAVGGDAKN